MACSLCTESLWNTFRSCRQLQQESSQGNYKLDCVPQLIAVVQYAAHYKESKET